MLNIQDYLNRMDNFGIYAVINRYLDTIEVTGTLILYNLFIDYIEDFLVTKNWTHFRVGRKVCLFYMLCVKTNCIRE